MSAMGLVLCCFIALKCFCFLHVSAKYIVPGTDPLVAIHETESSLGPRALPLNQEDAAGPLFLTEYVESGRAIEARRLSEVRGVPGMHWKSFSGYLTVRPQQDAHLFFWFLEAKKNPQKAPVILWHPGGPGTSSLTALFSETGPYSVTPQNQLRYREDNWSIHFNMLYIDSPVGTGYSYSNSSYHNDSLGAAQDVYIALQQFFTIFSEYSSSEFYICGHSYGAKIGFVLADMIDLKNRAAANRKINLTGVISLGGLVDPVNLMAYADYWYQDGMLNLKDYPEALRLERQIVGHIDDGDYLSAYAVFSSYLNGAPGRVAFLLASAGIGNGESVLETLLPPVFSDYRAFVMRPDVRRAIHVGNVTFGHFNGDLAEAMGGEFLQSVAPVMASILDKGYKVLMMGGNLDIYTIPMAYFNVTRLLKWKHAELFNNADRVIWKVDQADEELAGYVTCAENLCHALVRNAGHRVAHDQTRATSDALQRFIYNLPFSVNFSMPYGANDPWQPIQSKRDLSNVLRPEIH